MSFLAQIPKDQLIHQLEGGVILMILGLATVFVFLALLIFLTKGTSALARKFAPTAKSGPAPGFGGIQSLSSTTADAEVAAAIAVAFAKSKE
jgi:oxaloacetate decarboxylase gamma subunit